MSIAQQYPARTDANGNTWYRPMRPRGFDFDQWGWTSDPAQADPSYAAAAVVCAKTAPGTSLTPEDRAAVLEFRQYLAGLPLPYVPVLVDVPSRTTDHG
ncbi:hypothetical protein [Mycobacteroides abscessus]|uniref:hypothetical protein n=1 Tax=Mycobacteroides abscessus TaxID=36809 RepID=UPI0002F1EAC9|nr:hypothetical protein [Mycobacteroides abscessus]